MIGPNDHSFVTQTAIKKILREVNISSVPIHVSGVPLIV